MNGGTEKNPEYQLGSPIFDKIIIHLNQDFYSGKTFEINANNNNADNLFVNELQWNNTALEHFSLKHEDIVRGGVLELDMGKNKVSN